MKFSEMSDKELMDEVLSFNPDCLGSRDVINSEACKKELEKRGFEITEVTTYRFEKDGVEITEFDKKGKAIVDD